MMLLSYLVKMNNWFRVDADELQARPVALEELCKQPEKDGPHLLILEHGTHKTRTSSHSYAKAALRVTGYRQLMPSLQR